MTFDIFSLPRVMPCFILFTNVSRSAIPGGFMAELSKLIAQEIKKPETYVTVRVHPDQMMMHGGTDEPCGNSELQSVGNLGPEINANISKQISEFLQKKLGIDSKRNYIKFTDMERAVVGYNGTTFKFI